MTGEQVEPQLENNTQSIGVSQLLGAGQVARCEVCNRGYLVDKGCDHHALQEVPKTPLVTVETCLEGGDHRTKTMVGGQLKCVKCHRLL